MSAEEDLKGSGRASVEHPPTYEELFETHGRRLARLCRLLLGDPQESQEVVQEVFLKLHQAFDRPDTPGNWGAWLTRVTVNACHDRRRAGWWMRFRRYGDRVEDVTLLAREASPEERAIGEETWRRVWAAFRRLPDRQREVFVLRQLEGWSTQAVADALGLRTGSVKSHLFRAIHRLRAAAADGRA